MSQTSIPKTSNPFADVLATTVVPPVTPVATTTNATDPAAQMQLALTVLHDYPLKVEQLTQTTLKLREVLAHVEKHSTEFDSMKGQTVILSQQKAEAESRANKLAAQVSALGTEVTKLRELPQAVPVSAGVGQTEIRQLPYSCHVPISDSEYLEDELDQDIRDYVKDRRTLLLTGPAGASKTARAKQACAALGLPMVKFNVVNDSALDSMLYTQTIGDSNKIIKQEGVLAWALRQKDMVLLFDEDDTGPERWKYMKLSLLDPDSRQITLDDGTHLKADPSLCFMFTTNNIGQDISGMYSGSMPTAVLNRMRVIKVPRPDLEFVLKVITLKTGMDESPRTGLPNGARNIAHMLDVWSASEEADGSVRGPFSLRIAIAVATDIMRGMCPRKALRYNVLDKMDPIMRVNARQMIYSILLVE